MNKIDPSTCKSLRGLLSDYVDGDLSEELCREIENHAAGCEDCRIVVDTLRKTVALYHATAAEPAEIPGETREHLYKILNIEDLLPH
jgi:predicted anti-sigma-YlaC factor YlaD